MPADGGNGANGADGAGVPNSDTTGRHPARGRPVCGDLVSQHGGVRAP
jgi:hypothetical protein